MGHPGLQAAMIYARSTRQLSYARAFREELLLYYNIIIVINRKAASNLHYSVKLWKSKFLDVKIRARKTPEVSW